MSSDGRWELPDAETDWGPSSADLIEGLTSPVAEESAAQLCLPETRLVPSPSDPGSGTADPVEWIADNLTDRLRAEIRDRMTDEFATWQRTAGATLQAALAEQLLPAIDSLDRSTKALRRLSDLAESSVQDAKMCLATVEALAHSIDADSRRLSTLVNLVESTARTEQDRLSRMTEEGRRFLEEMSAARGQILDAETSLAEGAVAALGQMRRASRNALVAAWVTVGVMVLTSLMTRCGPTVGPGPEINASSQSQPAPSATTEHPTSAPSSIRPADRRTH